MKKNIKLIYSYDGSDFFGFQRQPKLRTVQGEIEKILKIIFRKDIDLISAGRTDRGVHAKMQVSNFLIENRIPVDKIKDILNELLPKDIVIKKVEIENQEFSSRFSAKYRAYEYYITNEKNPFKSRYTTYFKESFDIEVLNEIIKVLKGKHNFSKFRLSDCGSKTTEREIYEIYFERVNERVIKLYVKGNAFLKSQIRIIVGTTMAIYSGKKPKDYLKKMLENREEVTKLVAEPYGLYLSEIGY